MHRATPTLALVLTLALGACGSGGDTAAPTDTPIDEVTVVGSDDLAFSPGSFTVTAGTEVELVLRSSGDAEHDLVLEDGTDVASTGGHDMDDTEGGTHGDDGDHGEGDEHGDEHGDEVPEGDLHLVHAEGGDEASTTLTVDQPGTYTLYCSVPGHREAGMEATLEVVEG